MQHFLIFIVSIFFILIFSFFHKESKSENTKNTVRIYAYSSFTSKSGPGPFLKEEFEKNCDCEIDFIDAADAGILLQRIKLEGSSLGADLVIGFDQFDLQKALTEIKWRKIDFSQLEIDESLKTALNNDFFVPFDWGVLTFVGRKDDNISPPHSLTDLIKPAFKRKFAMQDPRTSSPGMQFLYWVKKSIPEKELKKYLSQIMDQAHSFSPSWSIAYSLFIKKQVHYVFSYTTSPLYHQLVEKNSNYYAIPFVERHPQQFEFAGIPADCKQCEKAEEFVNFMLSEKGQKVIMNKNFMYPVIKKYAQGTLFDQSNSENNIFNQLIPFEIPSVSDTEAFLKIWSDVRKGTNIDF